MLTIAIDQAWPPFQYLEAGGQAAGFDVDLAIAIAAELGLEARFVPATWAAAQAEVREGAADCIFSLTPTDERALVFDFSEIYRHDTVAVIVEAAASEQRIEDLYGKKVAAEEGGLNWMRVTLGTHFDHFRITRTESLAGSLDILRAGQVEAAIVGAKEVGIYLARQMGLEFRSVYEAAGVAETVGVKKGNTALLAEINRALGIVNSNGTFDQIYAKWFGAK